MRGLAPAQPPSPSTAFPACWTILCSRHSVLDGAHAFSGYRLLPSNPPFCLVLPSCSLHLCLYMHVCNCSGYVGNRMPVSPSWRPLKLSRGGSMQQEWGKATASPTRPNHSSSDSPWSFPTSAFWEGVAVFVGVAGLIPPPVSSERDGSPHLSGGFVIMWNT